MGNKVNLVIGVIVVVSLLSVGASYVSADGSHWSDDPAYNETSVAAPPTDNVTVVTTQVFRDWVNEGEVLALSPSGDVMYRDASRSTYHDVDPSPVGGMTVTYVAGTYLSAAECPTQEVCTKNEIVRVNLTTGREEVLYTTYLPERFKWHDVDRLNKTHYVVADIVNDRVFYLNVSSGERGWTWNADRAFAHSSGGNYPEDWTHLNDVETLQNGQLLVSLRNQDQVVFIDPGSGVVENKTLGCEDCKGILYEQHNPDYIPPEHGGPALLVADSENNRVVEYQRRNDAWRQSWVWKDAQLQWPRDADRLPNGNTLVTDSNGNRVIEVAPNGSVVWSVSVGLPYEAERLGKDDESTGPAAQAMDTTGNAAMSPTMLIKAIVPQKVLSGVMFVAPKWVAITDLVNIFIAILGTVVLFARKIVSRYGR